MFRKMLCFLIRNNNLSHFSTSFRYRPFWVFLGPQWSQIGHRFCFNSKSYVDYFFEFLSEGLITFLYTEQIS